MTGTVYTGLLYTRYPVLYVHWYCGNSYFFVSGMIIDKTKIQQEVYSKSWCFAHSMLSCLSSWNLCKCIEGQCRNFFLVYSTCMIFFFTKFSLAWIFFFVRCPPTITFPMIRPLRWVAQERANNPTSRKINICISARRKTWKSDKTEKLLVRDRHTLLY